MRTGLGLLLVILIGCGGARAGEPLYEKPSDGALFSRGEELFMAHCNPCHPGGSAGHGTAIITRPALPGLAIRAQVRSGLGVMPAFDHERLPEEDLDAILVYIDALQETLED